MPYLPANKRVWSIDILRGVYIFIIVLAHSIFFFHQGENVVLTSINTLADTISFTGLLFISGTAGYIAYVHEQHPSRGVRIRLVRRLMIYLVSYYALAIFADSIINDFSWTESLKIIGFLKLVSFTEFIVAFIVFGVLQLPFRKAYQHLSRRPMRLLLLGSLLYLVGTILSAQALPLPAGWQAIFVGRTGWYSFPIFQYSLVYLLGIRLGRLYWEHTARRALSLQLLKTGLGLMIVILGLLVINSFIQSSSLAIDQRFPPSVTFILGGLLVVISGFWIIFQFHRLTKVNSVKIFILLLGQNAFALFFTHTLLLYLYVGFGFPPIYSSILTGLLFVLSLFFSMWLARILPFNYRLGLTFIGWCECKFGECNHDQNYHREQFIAATRSWKRFIDATAFPLGHKTFRVARMRHILVALGLMILVAAPLGVAENSMLVVRLIEESKIETNREWYMPTQTKELVATYQPPADLMDAYDINVFMQIDSKEPVAMTKKFQTYTATYTIEDLDKGAHQIRGIVALGESKFITQEINFQVTEPLYVTWTIDWEGYDVPNAYLDALISIAEKYRMPMTHLFNPRIYTNTDISTTRADYLTDWVKNRQAFFGEEIGLHLHMFPDFIAASGVVPKDQPVWGGGFTPGYDVLTTAYNQEEMEQILAYAKTIFLEKGLGQPRSYRAGAWFADITTLKALEASEFLVDSSGRTMYQFGTNRVSGYWSLAETAQPYFPSTVNQNGSLPPPTLRLLEVPNNGADSYAFSSEQMISRLNANYPGGVVHEKRQVTFLSHPHWFQAKEQEKMIQVFERINQLRYEDDLGPVIPTNLIEIYQAWTDDH